MSILFINFHIVLTNILFL